MSSFRISLEIEAVGPDRLRALWAAPDAATVYSAEFSDNLAGSIGLCRFVAMLRVVTGYPVQIVSESGPTFIQSDAMRSVLGGHHPPVRFDGRYSDQLQGGVEHEAADT